LKSELIIVEEQGNKLMVLMEAPFLKNGKRDYPLSMECIQ